MVCKLHERMDVRKGVVRDQGQSGTQGDGFRCCNALRMLYIIAFYIYDGIAIGRTVVQEDKAKMSQQHTKAEKRVRRKRYQERARARINALKAAAKKK